MHWIRRAWRHIHDVPRRRLAWALAGGVTAAYLTLFAVAGFAAYSHGTGEEAFLAYEGDSKGYVALARTLVSTGSFSTPTGEPEFVRTPGYPAFVATGLVLADSLVAVILIQIVLTGFAVALVFLIGETFFSRPMALGASLLFALDPTTMVQTFGIYTEMLFTVLLIAVAYLVFKKDRTLAGYVFAGLLGGAAVLVRPVGLYLIPFIILGAAFTWQIGIRRATRDAAIVLAGVCLVVMPWMTRNLVLGGEFSVSSILAFNPLFYNVVLFESHQRGVSQDVVTAELMQRLGATDRSEVKTFALSDEQRALTKEYLLPQAIEYGWFHAVKTIPFFVGSSIEVAQRLLHNAGVLTRGAPPDADVTGRALNGDIAGAVRALLADPLVLLERLVWACLWASAGLYTLFVLIRRRSPWRVAVVFLGFACIVAVMTSPVFSPRYRLPAEPFVFLLAFQGFSYVRAWWQSR